MELLQTSFGPIAHDSRGQGPPILMLPSGAHSRHDFEELRGALGERFRTHAIDWPAHGDSPASPSATSAIAFADLTEEVVAQLAPGGAFLVGSSVGGFAATRLAIRRPELVRGLAVLGGGGFAGRPLQVRAFCALMSRPRFLRRVYPSFSALYMRARTEADHRARADAIATTRTDPGLRTVTGLWASFATREHDLREAAREIATPTLLIWGRRDPVIPPTVARRAAAAIPDSRLCLLDTGHLPHTSDPRAVAAELGPFAERALGTAPALSIGPA